MSDLVYLYGFVPADAPSPERLIGIGGCPVEVVSAGATQAAISHVPANVYDPTRIEGRLQDLNWVAEQGVAHETVVAWFVDNAQILPAPLFTMYSTAAALAEAVAARAAEVSAELARLRNKREWDVKVSFNEREAEKHAAELSPRIAELEQEAAEASPGKRYLLQKKRSDLLKSETRNAAHAMARSVLDATQLLVTETRTLPIPRTTDDLPVILYAALLVDRESEAGLIEVLHEHAGRLEAHGLGLVFSGPWAPYRFTGDHEREPAGSE